MEVSTGFWKKLICSDSTPRPRSGHSSVTFDSKMYVFAGHDGNDVLNDHYFLDLTSLKWNEISGNGKSGNVPSPRASHAAVVDQLTGIIYVFGGTGKEFGQSNKKDFYLFSIYEGTWQDIKAQGSIPCARYGHSLSFYKSKLYLFGGTSGQVFFNDFYIFHIETKSWIRVELTVKPGCRYKHSGKVLGQDLLIIGGTEYKTVKNDIWMINLENHECKQVNIQKSEIAGKYTHAAEVYNKSVYILGASVSFEGKASLWKLDFDDAKWKEVLQYGQRPRIVGFFTMGIYDGVCIIFGGNDNNKRLNDTFIYRLDICLEYKLRTFETLFKLIRVDSNFNNVTLISTEGLFFINKQILDVRAYFLSQQMSLRDNQYVLQLNYKASVIESLLEYILCDRVNPLQDISNLLHLFSISVQYCIPALSQIAGEIISRIISEYNVKEIALYISENSINRLFHRQHLEENIKSQASSPIAQVVLKHILSTFDMSIGERIYWLCINTLAQYNINSGLNEDILSDIRVVKNKEKGKHVPKKTNSIDITSDLLWAVRLLYESDKDFTVQCDDNIIKVHKIILISNSVYFEHLSSSSPSDSCTLQCKLSDFNILVKYFYFGLEGIKSENPQQLAELLPLSDYLQLTNKDLHNYVGSMIKEDLSSDNIFEVMQLAQRINSNVMLQVVYEYFIENYSELVQREEMMTLPIKTLVDLHRWRAAKSSASGEF